MSAIKFLEISLGKQKGIISLLDFQRASQKEENRGILRPIIEIALFCAEQEVALELIMIAIL